MKFQGAATIPNRTQLETLEARIEQAANDRMVPLLLANELKRHTRRGERGCDCEYCRVKRRTIFVYHSQLQQYNFLEMESRVQLVRLQQINAIRNKLNEIKHKAGGVELTESEKTVKAVVKEVNKLAEKYMITSLTNTVKNTITIHNGTGSMRFSTS